MVNDVNAPAGWMQLAVSLRSWAGQEARLQLIHRAVDKSDPVGFWSQIKLVEKGASRVAQLECVTRSAKEAFAACPDVIIITTQSLQHERVFGIIRPFLAGRTKLAVSDWFTTFVKV